MKRRIVRKSARRIITGRKKKQHKHSKINDMRASNRCNWWKTLLQGSIPTLLTFFGLGALTYFGVIRQIKSDWKTKQLEIQNIGDSKTRQILFDIIISNDSTKYDQIIRLIQAIKNQELRKETAAIVVGCKNIPFQTRQELLKHMTRRNLIVGLSFLPGDAGLSVPIEQIHNHLNVTWGRCWLSLWLNRGFIKATNKPLIIYDDYAFNIAQMIQEELRREFHIDFSLVSFYHSEIPHRAMLSDILIVIPPIKKE